ncbi:reverse transcriptase N-terminal domain-containing protein [Streptomyces sp. NPDC002018]|uniref:reverse transcriptase N-terminal domain-containing protein n=1 Tax=Streptomyces sp. NPDC002018 TaxID=3364629 RepID=UPI0036755CE5
MGGEPAHPADWHAAGRLRRQPRLAGPRLQEVLRQRIFTASKEGDLAKVRNLQKLMLRNLSNPLVSVRRVPEVNAGRKGGDASSAHSAFPSSSTGLIRPVCRRRWNLTGRPGSRRGHTGFLPGRGCHDAIESASSSRKTRFTAAVIAAGADLAIDRDTTSEKYAEAPCRGLVDAIRRSTSAVRSRRQERPSLFGTAHGRPRL